MNNLMDYKILIAESAANLEDDVRAYIEQGWHVSGAASQYTAITPDGSESRWTQTLVLFEDNPPA